LIKVLNQLSTRQRRVILIAMLAIVVAFGAPLFVSGQPRAESLPIAIQQATLRSNPPTLAVNSTVSSNTESKVYIEPIDWLNVRYGPGIHYPRIGTISKGTTYQVLHRDPELAWLEITYPEFAGGRGWVYRLAVAVSGDLNNVPITTETTLGYPTLTSTPPMVITSVPLWAVTPIVALGDRLGDLSDSIYRYLLDNNFEPGTEKVGSVFLMDLHTGQPYSINPGVSYSGMSLIKLPILVAVYRKIATIPTSDQAQAMALMIICSENLSANELLSFLGDGDIYRGADYVTETMQALGLKDTFLAGPLAVEQAGPTATIPPLNGRQTTANQQATAPDPLNQTTPADLGWLLAGLYQCALDGTGHLPLTFPNELTVQKCRGILRVLQANDIPALLRAGVPDGIQVAHKHGWIAEVHGDAGIISTPGGDYVLVVILRNRTWLNYEESFPTIAEISRMAYNTFNPAQSLDQTHTESVPLCSLGSIDPQLFPDLRSGTLPPIR
jgi:beta-lactamase class A